LESGRFQGGPNEVEVGEAVLKANKIFIDVGGRALVPPKAPYTLLQRAMHVHPTVSEWVPTMLEDLMPLR
jgi:hypothetical protein